MHVGSLLQRRSEDRPHHPALIHRNQRISFAQLQRRTESIRGQLAGLGVAPGMPVALVLPNCPEFAYLYLALMRMGAIVAPVDPCLGVDELQGLLHQCRIQLAFTAAGFAHAEVLRGRLRMVTTDELVLDRAAPDASPPSPDPTATALYLHTSGTTGMPKVVELSHANLRCFPRIIGQVLDTSGRDVYAMALPMTHVSGPILLNEVLDKGASLVIFDRIAGSRMLAAIAHHRITFVHAVPPIFQMMLAAHPERYDLSSLRVAAMMGTSVPLAVMQEFKAHLPRTTVLQGFGMTETSPLLTLTPLDRADSRMDSIGLPVPMGEVFIEDRQGRRLPPGHAGEIVARGPMLMKGYLRNPQATAARIRGGVFHTGDAGRQDAEGFFYHLGRMDDQIVTRQGLNVYPAEVENVLLLHPAVTDVAVVGVGDTADRGRVLAAYVVSRTEAVGRDELRRHCSKRLAAYKVPKHFEFMSELPRNATGKLLRERLGHGR